MSNKYIFEISLTVLDHLWRNLYRSFMTVLWEAVSNAWDANAKHVEIFIDKEAGDFLIKDNWDGMTDEDFRKKFLKIWYSKREEFWEISSSGRPFIGRKWIGKLALLSCAQKISILTKTVNGNFTGWVIDNKKLDDAINKDKTAWEYELGAVNPVDFADYLNDFTKWTIIKFEGVKDGINNSEDYLKRLIALYFRFSLLDNNFKISINDDEVTYKNLSWLAEKTEFLWQINDIWEDPFLGILWLKETSKRITTALPIKGFIASVIKPRDIKIPTTDEKATIDLFVNWRLREKDILKHISSSSVKNSYMYWQIHFDSLDTWNDDRFTSSREGVKADDIMYQKFLKEFQDIILKEIFDDWDILRRKYREDWDGENDTFKQKKDRKAEEYYNTASRQFKLEEGENNKSKIDWWLDELSEDAKYNFESYSDCFISENLIRRYVIENWIEINDWAKGKIEEWKRKEEQNKNNANLSIEIPLMKNELGYLSMDDITNLCDKSKDKHKEPWLSRDAIEYKPMRNVVMHTALLTEEAKNRLSGVFVNIVARIKKLISQS